MTLPAPECTMGYPYEQVVDIMGQDLSSFLGWMSGQTMSLCEGRRYNHDTKEYETACGGVAHGTIIYTWDVERFLDGRPIID